MVQSRATSLGKLDESDAEFHAFVDHIVAAFNPRKVIWFGPRAQGEPVVPDSEYELLVVFDELPDWKEMSVAIRLSFDRRFSLDLRVRSSTEWEHAQAVRGTIADEIGQSGVTLYAR